MAPMFRMVSKGQQGSEEPDCQDQPGIAEIASHKSGRSKDAAPDDATDQQTAGGKASDAAWKFRAR